MLENIYIENSVILNFPKRCIVIYIKIENFNNISQYFFYLSNKRYSNLKFLISSDCLQKENSFSNLIRHLLQVL